MVSPPLCFSLMMNLYSVLSSSRSNNAELMKTKTDLEEEIEVLKM